MPSVDAAWRFLRLRHEQDNRVALGVHFAAQHDDVQARRAATAPLLSAAWDGRLAAVLLTRQRATAGDFAERVARGFGADFDPEIMTAWLTVNATRTAELINATTRQRLADIPIGDVYKDLADARLSQISRSTAATASNFGAHDAARASGAAMKTWQVVSGNPRSSHAAMNSSTVGIRDLFPNGMQWPGDPAGGAAENANCQCMLAYIGE